MMKLISRPSYSPPPSPQPDGAARPPTTRPPREPGRCRLQARVRRSHDNAGAALSHQVVLRRTGQELELAAFELRELRASFRRSGQAIPVNRMQDVNKAVEVMSAPMMDRVDKAIAARDDAAFTSATVR